MLNKAYSQVSPRENAKLHYRIVGFSVPAFEKDQGYKLEIAKGNHNAEAPFTKSLFVASESKSNKIIAEVPSFATNYTWRIIRKTERGEKVGPFYHFSTISDTSIGSDKARLRIVKQAAKGTTAYFFMDCTRALYDINGEMVWSIPRDLVPEEGLGGIEDLKCTSRGTITYIYHSKLYEITYDGKLLNRIPDTDSLLIGPEGVNHHEGTLLKRGNFMAVSNEMISWKVVGSDVVIKHGVDSSMGFKTAGFETLNEYDENGKIVWQYRVADYALHSDMINWKMPDGRMHMNVHLNAFYFDEENGYIYLGLKGISRILKVQYPQGNILAEFGKKFKEGEINMDHDLFCQQHAIRKRDGNLYLFNNNSCSGNPVPKLTLLREDSDALYGVRKIWEYECEVDVVKGRRSRGGNIIDLPDGAVFASLCTPYNDLLIVDRQKTLLWSAKSERWESSSNSWKELPNYRASILPSAAGLEAIIWYGQ
ncbi:MAG: aryl-sulfate sulfotransferase [Taibaiella sp.]|nr:aryl-sulfate sulfotransferase [Taibaiella sp.]